jgi:hypothetical protein
MDFHLWSNAEMNYFEECMRLVFMRVIQNFTHSDFYLFDLHLFILFF